MVMRCLVVKEQNGVTGMKKKCSAPSTTAAAATQKNCPDVGCTIIRLHGEQDLSTDPSLQALLWRVIVGDKRSLVLDLSQVGFIGVSTLRLIAQAHDVLKRSGRTLTVLAPSSRAARAIDLCGLHDLIVPDEEELVAGPRRRLSVIRRAVGPGRLTALRRGATGLRRPCPMQRCQLHRTQK